MSPTFMSECESYPGRNELLELRQERDQFRALCKQLVEALAWLKKEGNHIHGQAYLTAPCPVCAKADKALTAAKEAGL